MRSISFRALWLAGLLALASAGGAQAYCLPFYESEYAAEDWPAAYDARAVETRLAAQMLAIQRGLAIGQIPVWRAQALFHEQNWLRAMAARYQKQGSATPRQWQVLDWNLSYAWRHIQQSRLDCGY